MLKSYQRIQFLFKNQVQRGPKIPQKIAYLAIFVTIGVFDGGCCDLELLEAAASLALQRLEAEVTVSRRGGLGGFGFGLCIGAVVLLVDDAHLE